jgi:hypothetical protein
VGIKIPVAILFDAQLNDESGSVRERITILIDGVAMGG